MNSKNKETTEYKNQFSDIWTERMLVTSLSIWPENAGNVFKLIPHDEVFQDEATRNIYVAIKELYFERAEIKSLSIFQRLRAKGQFELIRREKVSLSYDEMIPRTLKEVSDTAEGILSLYRRQQAYELNIKLNSLLTAENKDSDIANLIYKTYEAITLIGGANLEKTSFEASKEALLDIDKSIRLHRAGKLAGVSTGSAKLDAALGGMQDDQVIIIAGRPGMGKTACAVDIAYQAAKSGTPVGYISMEMPAKRLKYRMAAGVAGIPYKRMRIGDLTDADYLDIENALSDIGKLPIYYFDDPDIREFRKLQSVATEWRRKHDLGLLIIDYVQYVEDENQNLTDTARVTKVSKNIKKMQRNLGIPVIGLAQLNRATEGRSDPRPKVSDLKDSGQLEQDGSVVIGLFNPFFYMRQGMNITDELEDEETKFDDNAYCYYILKSRDGDICRVDRFANLSINRFSDLKSGLGEVKTNQPRVLTDLNKMPIVSAFDYRKSEEPAAF